MKSTRRLALLFSLAALAASSAIAHERRIRAGDLPTCSETTPDSVWLLDAASATTCDGTTGEFEAHCCCSNGAWAACGGSGGGSGNSFETIDTTSGTDPVADSSTDTLTLTAGTGVTVTGDSSTDTVTIASTIPDITIDLDDDASNESTAVNKITTEHDVFGMFGEPNADELHIDVDALDYKYVHGPASSPGAFDCEFDGSICSGWTVVEGGSGTVNPIIDTTTEIYDLTTRPGWLLMQAGPASTDNVMLRYDVELADGEGAYVRMSIGRSGSHPNNSWWPGISVNTSDTAQNSGVYLSLYADTDTGGIMRFLMWNGGEIGGLYDAGGLGIVDLAITRDGDIYYFWVSKDSGTTWSNLGEQDRGINTLDNLWLFADGGTMSANKSLPVVGFDFVRKGTDNPYAPGW